MKIFLDSLDVNLIKKYSGVGLLAGITTNPTFSKRFGMLDDIEMVSKIREALGEGEIHVEAFGDTKGEIIKNVDRLLEKTNDSDLVFKIPFSEQGLSACKEFVKSGIKTNMHLIYSINQAILAAAIKSTYICPLVGRLDDTGHDAMENVKNIKEAFKVNSESTLIMVSSVRHPQHVLKAYMYGADVVTVPPNVLSQMFYHPLTDKGVHTFKSDIEATKPVSTKTINSNLVVNEHDTIEHCLSLMVMHKGGAVAIRSSSNRLAGIFTAGDLKRLIQKNIRFNMDDKIKKFMNKTPVSVDINETVSKAVELMQQFDIDQLVIVDNGSVVGILDVKEASF